MLGTKERAVAEDLGRGLSFTRNLGGATTLCAAEATLQSSTLSSNPRGAYGCRAADDVTGEILRARVGVCRALRCTWQIDDHL